MARLNIRSLLNKSFIINDLILDHKTDCLFLTETWLGTDATVILTEASPPDFNFLFSVREGKKGGGTTSIAHNLFLSKKYYIEHLFVF